MVKQLCMYSTVGYDSRVLDGSRALSTFLMVYDLSWDNYMRSFSSLEVFLWVGLNVENFPRNIDV